MKRFAAAWRRFAALPRPTRLLIGAALALAIALAGPTARLPAQRWNHVVIVDITQSMNTRDMRLAGQTVDRLAFVRGALREAVARLPCGSRIGIGVFSEYRSLLLMAPVEVCANYSDLPGIIARIDGRMSWAGASEVAKGVFSAVRTLRLMEDKPSLIFLTDGHEAPPLRPGERPRFDDPNDEIHGTVAGIGGDEPVPIPKRDTEGHPLGFWQSDEVMQTDSISLGQTAEGAKQTLVDESGRPVTVFPGSGIEHLSSLKETHLRDVAQIARLDYRRIQTPADLAEVLREPRLARPASVAMDLRVVPLLVALGLLGAAFVPTRRRLHPVATPAVAVVNGPGGVLR